MATHNPAKRLPLTSRTKLTLTLTLTLKLTLECGTKPRVCGWGK